MLDGATDFYPLLASVRDALAEVEDVKTCRIGMEAGITPADYPLVRLVPIQLEDGIARSANNAVEAWVYFGLDCHEFEDGLEALYAKLSAVWLQLMDAMRQASGVHSVTHVRTVFDEDRVEAFKLFAIRVKING